MLHLFGYLCDYQGAIVHALRAWRAREDRKPLVLRGARQVGKTTAVNHFGTEFRQFVALNLDHPRDREVFDQELPLDRTLEAIFFSRGGNAAEPDTLLFLDEVQSSPRAVRLWDGPVHLHSAQTVAGKKFRLLNLPFFLVHQLDAYLGWVEDQSH